MVVSLPGAVAEECRFSAISGFRGLESDPSSSIVIVVRAIQKWKVDIMGDRGCPTEAQVPLFSRLLVS